MYYNYYGLSRRPFELTVDRLCVYFGSRQREVVAQLVYGIRERKGLMVLEGEAGTGKTTLLDMVIALLPSHLNVYPCWIRNPLLPGAIDVLEAVLREFGQPCDRSARISELTDQLLRFLERCHRLGTTPVLIVDEAQDLGHEAMEQIRVLTNWEKSGRKLIQIILSGQPELASRYLDAPDQEALRQRIALRCRLQSISPSETGEYIRLRLTEAGGADSHVFETAAIREIYRRTAGIPRKINVVADHCLVAGYALQMRPITSAVVSEVAGELNFPVLESEVSESDLLGEGEGTTLGLSDLFREFLSEEASTATSELAVGKE